MTTTTTTTTTTAMTITLPMRTPVSNAESPITSEPTLSSIQSAVGNATNTTSMISANQSSAVTMPAAESTENNSALIGGIVGGAVALILVGALIVFFVLRSRKARQDSNADQNAHATQSIRAPPNNYGQLSIVQSAGYSEIPTKPPTNYDNWADDTTDVELEQRSRYEDFSQIH